MRRIFAALNSKGGVGKTTLLANLSALLADMGFRVLIVDCDPQPAITKYYELTYEAPHGLVEVITSGAVTHLAISRTTVSNLDLVRSNDGEAQLQFWLHAREDRRVRLARALDNPYVRDHYDFVLIDTQGALGPLQTAAAFAADTLIAPLPPDTPSVREFRSRTLQVLKRLEEDEKEPRAQLAPIQAVICKTKPTRNAKSLMANVQAEFEAGDRVNVLQTTIPDAAPWEEAFTLRVPVYTISTTSGARNKSGYEVMHSIVWELLPELYGLFAGRMRGDPADVFGWNKKNGEKVDALPTAG